jgi:DNA polymerase-1
VRALPFHQVWLVDFEFGQPDGERPTPRCMVAKEWRSGRIVRLWLDDPPASPPFPTNDDSLFVAYMAVAELSCFRVLGWPMPHRILDLYVEASAIRSGVASLKPSLLTTLSMFGLPHIDATEKDAMRELAIRGGTYTDAEKLALLDYCQSDVDALDPLLARMWPQIDSRPKGLGQALLRGRYMAAVTEMDHAGVPIDVGMVERLRASWDGLKLRLIEDVDQAYGVYDGTSFRMERFERWLMAQGMPWLRTETGQLKLDQDTFHDMARAYPQVQELGTLRHDLATLRLERLAIGRDGRNRAPLFPFGAKTGRNTPTAAMFVFNQSAWLRSLIKPTPGQVLAYLDWSCQEVGIAAALSGDPALLEAMRSGDPYLAFARMAGLVGDGTTAAELATARKRCKTCMLGHNYGMGADSLATRLGISLPEAKRLRRALVERFPVYADWADRSSDHAELSGHMETVFGWPMQVGRNTTGPQMRNWPMQANGAEMLRLACCLAIERGVTVCAPVHDAVLIEASVADLEDAVATMRAAMAEASVAVLETLELETDVQQVVRWPDRYRDPDRSSMWDRVQRLLS